MEKPDWTPSGHRTYYYDDGVTKRYEGNYVNGVKQGEFTYYARDGKKRATIFYVDGIVTGNPRLYDVGNEHTSVMYTFDYGILTGSVHRNNNNIIGVYNYEDKNRFHDPDLPLPPPIGTMWHGDSTIDNPTEMFRGTVWSWIKNSYYIDDQGATRDVSIWIREPDSTGGGTNYGPYLIMNDFTEMREDGAALNTGKYVRKMNGDESTSVLDGIEYTWDYATSLPITKSHWDMGVQRKMEVLELNDKVTIDTQRTWHYIVKNSAGSVWENGWFSTYDITQDIHTVLTPTLRFSFNGQQVATVNQQKQDTLG